MIQYDQAPGLKRYQYKRHEAAQRGTASMELKKCSHLII